MSEDRFYQQVRSTMTDYSEDVPASVYAAMRKKLWWSNFMQLNVTRFNVWYALAIVAGLAAYASWGSSATVANSVVAAPQSDKAILATPIEVVAPAPDLKASDAIVVTPQENPTVLRNSSQSHTRIASEPATEELAKPTEVASTDHLVATDGSMPVHPSVDEQNNVSKPGGKKGLKVKTYNSADSRKD